MVYKVTGLRLSPECVMRLKMYSFCTGRSMSEVVESLVNRNIGMFTGEPCSPEENTSESE